MEFHFISVSFANGITIPGLRWAYLNWAARSSDNLVFPSFFLYCVVMLSYAESYFKKFLCLEKPTVHRLPDIVRIFFVLVSTFASIIALEGTFKYGPEFVKHSTPIIVPSWAATIILTCNALESPLGQPFPQFVGTILSSILGIGLTKIWVIGGRNEETLFVCGALALALSSIMMTRLNVVHPAAGSAALLAAISPPVRDMGWYYLVVQIVTAIIVIGVGSIFGNMYAQYPLYWLLPPKLASSTSTPPPAKIEEPTTTTSGQETPSDGGTVTSTNNAPPSSIDTDSITSLARVPTAQDDQETTPQTNFSLRNAISRTLSNSQYLSRIATSPESVRRLENEMPQIDLESTAVLTSTDFSLPSELTFSLEDRGILLSIQRKLAALEAQ